MDITTIILMIISIFGLILLFIGNMTDKETLMTIGGIFALLGTLFLFTYKFLTFLMTSG